MIDPLQQPAKKNPHNLDAEQALLGALLMNNALFSRVPDGLQAVDFFDPIHGRIFAVIKEMISKGALADPITLRPRFAEDEGLAEIGGVDYLVDLANSPYPDSAAGEYAKLIHDLSLKRNLIALAEETIMEARNGDSEEDGSAQIESVERKLLAISQAGRQAGSGARSFSHITESAVNRVMTAYETGFSGLRTGVTDLDNLIKGMRPGELIVIMGDTGMGKSTLGSALAWNVALSSTPEEPRMSLTFSAEMPGEAHAERFYSSRIRVPYEQIGAGEIHEHEIVQLREAALACQSLPWEIDDSAGLFAEQIMARARRAALKGPLSAVFIDHIGLYRAHGARGDYEKVTQLAIDMKSMARELGVPVIVLCQIKREVRGRDNKRPTLGDAKNTGELENSADLMIGLFREAHYLKDEEPEIGDTEGYLDWNDRMEKKRNVMETILLKNRRGPLGKAEIFCDIRTCEIGDLDHRQRDAA